MQVQIKKLIDQWDERRGKRHTTELAFIHLQEEIGELARQFINKAQRPEKYSEDELKDAIGDVTCWAFFLASLHNIEVEDLISNIIKRDTKLLEDKRFRK